jgi:hypothetical protein
MSIDELGDEVLKLDSQARARLAARLLESLKLPRLAARLLERLALFSEAEHAGRWDDSRGIQP